MNLNELIDQLIKIRDEEKENFNPDFIEISNGNDEIKCIRKIEKISTLEKDWLGFEPAWNFNHLIIYIKPIHLRIERSEQDRNNFNVLDEKDNILFVSTKSHCLKFIEDSKL